MRISKSGKQVFPEKSGFCGKSSTPAHVRFFPKPFISFASAQLRLRWHSPCARRLQQEVADRKPGGCERPRFGRVRGPGRAVQRPLRFHCLESHQYNGTFAVRVDVLHTAA
jgi:hypothetical protein